MEEIIQAIKVTDDVYWVGAIDWNVRNFHGYETSRGTTYNAYLVLAEKITLIDTVKAPFRGEMMARIASVIDPQKIDYIISNHAEMDHSGSLPETIDAVQPEKVFASKLGVKALHEIYPSLGEVTAVEDGSEMSLGNMKVKFVATRMLHWPDSMFTYLYERKILFSQDGFGMHLAASQRFDDEVDQCVLLQEAAKYYANILLPFSPIVTRTINKLTDQNLDLDIIAPVHGPIWRKDVKGAIDRYLHFARQEPTTKAVVAYDTMWHSTEKMAQAICEGITAGGGVAKSMRMYVNHRSDVATEILKAGAFVVGASTLNNNMLPAVADVLYYIKGLKPKNLVGEAFGSYGWSGESVQQVRDILTEMEVELVGEKGLKVLYVPDTEALKECRALGEKIAEKMREKCSSSHD